MSAISKNPHSWSITESLRRIIATIKNRKSVDSVRYYIDKMSMNGSMLTIAGWAFSLDGSPDTFRLRIENKGLDYYLVIPDILSREDVYEVFGVANALSSGFSIDVLCEGADSFSVFLQIRSGTRTNEVFLGNIETDQVCQDKTPQFSIQTELRLPQTSYVEWQGMNVLGQSQLTYPYIGSCIDIILPVYNGYEYFEGLFGSVCKTDMPYRLIVIDDCSTDKRVWPYLQKLALNDASIILERNEKNLGFVKTANRGFSLSQGHVALINSDIVLPEHWLERLMRPIILDSKIASATPFSNCGSLCSFPIIGKDNALFEGLTCQQIDNAFLPLRPAYTAIPTGVGFCMGISKNALDDVGFFDDKLFTRGYCEENDWCLRAIKQGFTNVQVENLFVFHKHGGSFTSDEKSALLNENLGLLVRKYPEYSEDVASYYAQDPTKEYRYYASLSLLVAHKHTKTHMVFNHVWGGGATKYLDEWEKRTLSLGEGILRIQYSIALERYYFTFLQGSHSVVFRLDELEELDSLIEMLGVSNIVINELVSYPDLAHFLNYIIELKHLHTIPITFLLHDFYSVCPTINLIASNGNYCALEHTDCDKCLAANTLNYYPKASSMEKWREIWNGFLRQCDEIIAFSESSAEILLNAYPLLEPVAIRPHTITPLPTLKERCKISDTVNIALLGTLNECKGGIIIKEMLGIADSSNMSVRFILLGHLAMDISSERFSVKGNYSVECLPRAILENDIDAVFISSIWPETFSYTTAEAIRMGLPIASFMLGAQGAQISRVANGLLLQDIQAESAFPALLNFSQNASRLRPRLSEKVSFLFIVKARTELASYRIEQLRERLLYAGVTSDLCLSSQIKNIISPQYSALIISNCPLTEELQILIEEMHSCGKKVFYDIDQAVCENAIASDKHLPQSCQDERQSAEETFACIEKCDLVIASHARITNYVRSRTSKPVLISQNAITMETEVVSEQIVREASGNEMEISCFHDRAICKDNLEIVELSLVQVMSEFPEVRVTLIGKAEIPQSLETFRSRIAQRSPAGWSELLQILANTDICIIPSDNCTKSECNSEMFWMRAALMYVPSIVQKTSDSDDILMNDNTCLFYENVGSLESALSSTITDQELVRRVATTARAFVLENLTTQTMSKDDLDILIRLSIQRENIPDKLLSSLGSSASSNNSIDPKKK